MVIKVESIIKELGQLCKSHRLIIVTAESCTGDGIAYALSKSPESSSILERGYVTYSTQSEEVLLKVKSETIVLIVPPQICNEP